MERVPIPALRSSAFSSFEAGKNLSFILLLQEWNTYAKLE